MKKPALLIIAILLIPMPSSAQVTAAEEAYRKAESLFHQFVELMITDAKPRVIRKQLEKKTKLLKELESAYQKVIEFKEPVFVVAAMYKLGCAHENFADMLIKTPIPAGLTPEQADIYVQMLLEKSMPFREKAFQLFKATVKKAKELGTFTDHARLAEEKLSGLEKNLKPQKNLKPEKPSSN